MKNILLLSLMCAFLVGCEASEEKNGGLTDTQKTTLSQFSNAVATAFHAMDAGTIYSRGGRSFPKAVADEVKDCVKTPRNDASGRRLGVTVDGALCPVRAQWILRPSGNSTTLLDLAYRAQDDNFTQILPVTVLMLDGTRTVTSGGGSDRTEVSYSGSARDTSDDVVQFSVTIDKWGTTAGGLAVLADYTYTIRANFSGFVAEGKIVDNQKFYLNNTEITREEFDNLFFILK